MAILVFSDMDEEEYVGGVGWEMVWMRGYNVTPACDILQMQVYFMVGLAIGVVAEDGGRWSHMETMVIDRARYVKGQTSTSKGVFTI